MEDINIKDLEVRKEIACGDIIIKLYTPPLIFRVGEIHTVRSACLASDHAAQALIGVSRVHQYHM